MLHYINNYNFLTSLLFTSYNENGYESNKVVACTGVSRL